MPGQIDDAFTKQFQAEVHEAYQRQGSKLRPTVRSKSGIKGASTVFPRVGKGVAAAKPRAGAVPVMNLNHGTAECFLQDYYAGECKRGFLSVSSAVQQSLERPPKQ
ncbi:phage capsid protein [Roseomonas sp. BN140053]|uniref:phage capsid protein n=1 Tax=Roseomonas sp. BN140053 TaxID=3391898 RepID=UPI0039E8F56F